ncbi:MAG: DUF4340 domain-containing protein [Candidatus Omnitrophica bacterium]|nr:DUF4340 domain-containing protein [Candidatus Omnitrophota bacterium]
MKARRTLFFLFIFLAAFSLLWYVNFKENGRKEALLKLVKSNALFQHPIGDEMNYISMEHPHQKPIVLQMENGNWRITSPIQGHSDVMIARGLVAALRFGRKEEVFEPENGEQAASYGLKDTALRIGVGTKKSHRKQTLLLGRKAPLGNLYYARWEGSSQVFLVSENLRKAFDRSLAGIRRRLVFDFAPDQVKGFRISFAGHAFDIVRDGTRWKFSGNSSHGGEPVDPEQVEAYLDLLRGISVSEFVDGQNVNWRDEPYGIRLGQNYVNVYFDEAKPQILWIGYPSREVTGTYIHMQGIFSLALISSKIAKRLSRPASEFYERRIWKEPKRVERILIQTGGLQLDFSRARAGWSRGKNILLTKEQNKWMENTIAMIQEFKYISSYESNLKEEKAGNAVCVVKVFSSEGHSREPDLEIRVDGETPFHAQAFGRRGISAGQEARNYQVFKLESKDGEMLSDLVRHLI